MADNDSLLVKQLKDAIISQRQLFERKASTYEAVIKNFGILKVLCQKQQQEAKEGLSYSVGIERKYIKLKTENDHLQEEYKYLHKEVVSLRAKE